MKNLPRVDICASVRFVLALTFVGLMMSGMLDHRTALAKPQSGETTASVSLELPLILDGAIAGVYVSRSAQDARYFFVGPDFKYELNQSGREIWSTAGEDALHLTPRDLTDLEYAQLRVLIGPFGVPLLQVDQLLPEVKRHYTFPSTVWVSPTGDTVLRAKPRQAFRERLSGWMAYQTGQSGAVLNSLVPDTIELTLSKMNGRIAEIRQLNFAGKTLVRLTYDFERTSSIALQPFSPPKTGLTMESRDLMLAMGADPQWLIGKKAPSGVVRQLDGQSRSLDDFRGKPVLVNFWATWCGPCRIEWPVLQELYNRHGQAVAFVLASDEAAATVRHYVKSNGYTAPVYLLQDSNLHRGYGVSAFPSTYMVDSSGIIRHVFVGFQPKRTIEETRAALLEKYHSVLSDLSAAALAKPARSKG